jgi:hypothetical protein
MQFLLYHPRVSAGKRVTCYSTAGLRANDRAKYYMSVLLACRERAARPDRMPPNLAAEREASGEDDGTKSDSIIPGRLEELNECLGEHHNVRLIEGVEASGRAARDRREAAEQRVWQEAA